MEEPSKNYYALPHEVIMACPYQCKELLVFRYVPYQTKIEEAQGQLTPDNPLRIEFNCPNCGEQIKMSFVLPVLVDSEENTDGT